MLMREVGAWDMRGSLHIRDWVIGRGRRSAAEVTLAVLQDSFTLRAAGVDSAHVALLAENAESLPAVVVHRPTMRIVDGLHRVSAARHAGREAVSVDFFDGTEAEAFALSVYLNVGHGLPLTLADRKMAAAAMLTSNPEWSDRFVARLAGLSHVTISAIRRRLIQNCAPPSARLGGDGKIRPVDPATGRTRVAMLLSGNPSLTLRELSKCAGVSISTARDVRIRVQEGRDPVPDRMRGGNDACASDARSRKYASDVERSNLQRLSNHTQPERTTASEQIHVSNVLLERLKKDPAIRFNEAGRQLVRLLTITHAALDHVREHTDIVPSHCSLTVAQLAHSYSAAWQEIAQQMADHAKSSDSYPQSI